MVRAGEVSKRFHYDNSRNDEARAVQYDELWSFLYAKKNVHKV